MLRIPEWAEDELIEMIYTQQIKALRRRFSDLLEIYASRDYASIKEELCGLIGRIKAEKLMRQILS